MLVGKDPQPPLHTMSVKASTNTEQSCLRIRTTIRSGPAPYAGSLWGEETGMRSTTVGLSAIFLLVPSLFIIMYLVVASGVVAIVVVVDVVLLFAQTNFVHALQRSQCLAL